MNTKINTKRFYTLALLSICASGFTAYSINQYVKRFEYKGAWIYLIPASLGVAEVFTVVDAMIRG